MPDGDLDILWAWLAMGGILTMGIGAALAWAIRSGQFRGQRRAGRLPLQSAIRDPEAEKMKTRRNPP